MLFQNGSFGRRKGVFQLLAFQFKVMFTLVYFISFVYMKKSFSVFFTSQLFLNVIEDTYPKSYSITQRWNFHYRHCLPDI